MDDTGGEVGVLGSGSDYTAFVHNGIAAVSPLPSDQSEQPLTHEDRFGI